MPEKRPAVMQGVCVLGPVQQFMLAQSIKKEGRDYGT